MGSGLRRPEWRLLTATSDSGPLDDVIVMASAGAAVRRRARQLRGLLRKSWLFTVRHAWAQSEVEQVGQTMAKLGCTLDVEWRSQDSSSSRSGLAQSCLAW